MDNHRHLQRLAITFCLLSILSLFLVSNVEASIDKNLPPQIFTYSILTETVLVNGTIHFQQDTIDFNSGDKVSFPFDFAYSISNPQNLDFKYPSDIQVIGSHNYNNNTGYTDVRVIGNLTIDNRQYRIFHLIYDISPSPSAQLPIKEVSIYVPSNVLSDYSQYNLYIEKKNTFWDFVTATYIKTISISQIPTIVIEEPNYKILSFSSTPNYVPENNYITYVFEYAHDTNQIILTLIYAGALTVTYEILKKLGKKVKSYEKIRKLYDSVKRKFKPSQQPSSEHQQPSPNHRNKS